MAELTYSITEAAEALGISRRMMYSLIHKEGFPTLKVGRCRKISRELLVEWVRTQPGGQKGAALLLEQQDGKGGKQGLTSSDSTSHNNRETEEKQG